MITRKEIAYTLVAILIIAFSISMLTEWSSFAKALAIISIILLINLGTKKLMAYYLDSEIEIKLWEINRFGWKPQQKFKHPFPAGAFLPVLSKAIFFPIKGFVWMASLVFDIKPKKYRAAKRHGLFSFTEVSEYHTGVIAAVSILANLVAAVIAYSIGFSEFSRISIYYTFFNMLPISDLDGNKIFFGNLVMWAFLASIVLIGILFAIFVI